MTGHVFATKMIKRVSLLMLTIIMYVFVTCLTLTSPFPFSMIDDIFLAESVYCSFTFYYFSPVSILTQGKKSQGQVGVHGHVMQFLLTDFGNFSALGM